jgi:hypothetical protein
MKYDKKQAKKALKTPRVKSCQNVKKIPDKKINTAHSSEKKPLRASYSAQDFIRDHYKGDIEKAKKRPEWRQGTGNKVRLMIPDWRNTKAGRRVRWVLFK